MAQLECGKERTISLELAKKFRSHAGVAAFCDDCWTVQRVVNILDWPDGRDVAEG